MEKVIEILKNHNIEKEVSRAMSIAKFIGVEPNEGTDREVAAVKGYIFALLTRDQLTDEEEEIIITAAIEALSEKITSEFSIEVNEEKLTNQDKLVGLLAGLNQILK